MKHRVNNWIVVAAATLFVYGLYFYTRKQWEPFTNPQGNSDEPDHGNSCPDVLVQKNDKLFLYNTKRAKVPGVNPIEFDSLEDYTEFLEWQRSQGMRCPVLYLQSSFDAQGNETYKMRPSVSAPQGGLPPSVPTPVSIAPRPPSPSTMPLPPATAGSRPPAPTTSSSQDTTPNSRVDNSFLLFPPGTNQVSPNPMDPNWGGRAYTQSLIDNGYFKGDEVALYVP